MHRSTLPAWQPSRPPPLLLLGGGGRMGAGCCSTTAPRRARIKATEDGQQLASEFASLVNALGVASPLRDRAPTHLLPPTGVVEAQMAALQLNDWPEADAGVGVAFAFAKPRGVEELLPGGAAHVTHVRSWGAAERWLSRAEFGAQLATPPYAALLRCEAWRPASRLVFPSQRHGDKAVQAVHVTVGGGGDAAVGGGSGDAALGGGGARKEAQEEGEKEGERELTFTWCLEKIPKGPFAGCWLTVGVRVGNYAL